MNARRRLISWFLTAAALALLAATGGNSFAAEPTSTIPTATPMDPKKLPAALTAAIPAAEPTPPANPPASANQDVSPETKPDEAAAKAAAPAGAAEVPVATPEVHKSGIFSAVKAKGPPPMSKGPVAPPPLSPRFQQIRTKIGALFDVRNTPPAPYDPRANPFRPPGAVVITPASTSGAAGDGVPLEPAPVSTDLTALQQAVGTLRVKGTVARGKTLQLVITSAPGREGTYKEGDIINVALPPGDPVHVRVRQITAHSVTLTLNKAEMVLKF